MQYLNKVDLQGIVGTCKFTNIGDMTLARFALITKEAIRNKNGEITVEITWHNIAAWKSPMVSHDGLEKGAIVNLTGRIRNTCFITESGERRNIQEIIAGRLEIIPKENLE